VVWSVMCLVVWSVMCLVVWSVMFLILMTTDWLLSDWSGGMCLSDPYKDIW
jgi:hypothetical protein